MNSIEPIKIWEFHDAPEEFQIMSISGGDENYLALVPPSYAGKWISFLDSDSFGCCSRDEIPITKGKYKGYKLVIGTHA